MAIVRFHDLFNEMGRFQDEFNRLFRRAGFNGEQWASAGPAFNVWSDEHAVFVEVDLPGIDPQKLDISVKEGNHLTIQGERPQVELPSAVWHRQERGSGTFVREITLPVLVDVDKIEAKYADGVLRLTMPKHEAAKPRKIAIKA
jgi:HSP20 family protein